MALSQSTQLGLATALFGVLSFVLAVLAELKKVTHLSAFFCIAFCRDRDPPFVAC
jgi:hypothetical protein